MRLLHYTFWEVGIAFIVLLRLFEHELRVGKGFLCVGWIVSPFLCLLCVDKIAETDGTCRPLISPKSILDGSGFHLKYLLRSTPLSCIILDLFLVLFVDAK